MLLRIKEDYDGAEPAAGSVTVRRLLTLGHRCRTPRAIARSERWSGTGRSSGKSRA